MLDLFQPGCPWYELATRYPSNVEWCEQKICSFILTPFNTWTNLGYVLLGLYVWMKKKNSPSRVLRTFGPSIVIVGVTSFFYHGSLNYFSQLLDFIGMYLFAVTFLMLNLLRKNRWPSPPRAYVAFWLTIALLTLITVISIEINVHFPIQVYVFLLIVAITVTEFQAQAKTRSYFGLTLLCFIVAAVFSAMDVTRVFCVPDRHWLQGHGLWHMITALGLYFGYQHYLQFESELP